MHNFVPIILIAVSVGLYFMGISPLYERVKILQADIALLDAKVPPPQDLLDLRASLLAKYGTITAGDLERMEKVLPPAVENVALVLELNSIAARHNVLLTEVKTGEQARRRIQRQGFGQSEEEPPYQTAVLTFSLQGTYENFRSFMLDAERNIRLIDTVNLSFTQDEKEGLNRYLLTAQTYWQEN